MVPCIGVQATLYLQDPLQSSGLRALVGTCTHFDFWFWFEIPLRRTPYFGFCLSQDFTEDFLQTVVLPFAVFTEDFLQTVVLPFAIFTEDFLQTVVNVTWVFRHFHVRFWATEKEV